MRFEMNKAGEKTFEYRVNVIIYIYTIRYIYKYIDTKS